MPLNIRTNNVPRWTIEAYDLSDKERAEFDYLDWDAIDAGNDSRTFFRYKGHLYDLGDCMKVDHSYGMEGWDGYYADSAWSGVLVRIVDDERILVGQYNS